MVAMLDPTVTWRKSPSRLSLEKLSGTAQVLERLAQARGEPLDPRDAGAISLQREAESLRRMIDDLSLHLRSETLLAAMSNRLLNVRLDDIEQGIVDALGELGRMSAVQRAYVFLFSDDGAHLAGAYEWVAPGVQGHDFNAFIGTPVTAFPWSMEQFLRGQTVFVEDPGDLPPEAAPERGACTMLSILSYVNMPLFAGGKLVGWLGYDSVTERRVWTEEEMRLMVIAGDTLVNAVERKRREELLFRQRELNQRVASMGTLAAGLAHEINNPLAFVVGNLSYVRDLLHESRGVLRQPDIDDVTGALEQASEGAERVRRIVGDMRALAFGESSELGPVDLVTAIDTTLRMTSTQLRHCATVVREYDDAPAVLANPSQLGQVLINLVLNAVQALPEGRASENTVTIVARAAGERVQIEIRDTGTGIAPEILPRVFDPFFTTRGPGGGTGMGLAICHHLIHSFGGTIEIASQVGKGTTVLITLPRAGAGQPVAEPTGAARPQPADRWRILLVDDEPLVLDLLGRILKGHDLVRARNGREALAEIAQQPEFDLVFCDVMMPDVTGQDVYERLQRERPGLEQRIVFISGGTFTREMASFLDDVPNPKLIKPFETRSVRKIVDDMRAHAR